MKIETKYYIGDAIKFKYKSEYEGDIIVTILAGVIKDLKIDSDGITYSLNCRIGIPINGSHGREWAIETVAEKDIICKLVEEK